MEASQHSLLAACFTLHSINATLAIVPQRGAGLWITYEVKCAFRSRLDVMGTRKIVDLTGNVSPVVHLSYSHNRPIDLLYKLIHAQYSYY
jgi:hypothetical protein